MTIAAPVASPSAGRKTVSVGMSFGSLPSAPGAPFGQRGMGSAAWRVARAKALKSAARTTGIRIRRGVLAQTHPLHHHPHLHPPSFTSPTSGEAVKEERWG